jgi:acyl-coenzyme A thioesterase PaaI-like protein
MATEIAAPAGFEQVDLGSGFSERFRPVYLNRRENRLGFRVAAHHLNPVHGCHGGALATFTDMQIAAVRSSTAIYRNRVKDAAPAPGV